MTIPGPTVWKIHGRLGEFLVACRGLGDSGSSSFLDLPSLGADLDHHAQDDAFGLPELQEMLMAVDITLVPGAGDMCRSDSRRFVRDRLLDAFRREDLVIVQAVPAQRLVRGDDKSEETPPPKPTSAPAPPAKPVAVKTWIAIKLIDEAGKPCAKERFKVTLPDGSAWEGRLDAEGQARKDGIDAGTCKVTFPDLGPSTGKS